MTVDVQTPKSEVIYLSFILAKLWNTGPLIYFLLNHNSAYSVPLCTSKGFDTCKTDGPAFCSCSFIFNVLNATQLVWPKFEPINRLYKVKFAVTCCLISIAKVQIK